MQTCTKCKKEKDFSGFNKNDNYKSGYHSWCRKCTREQNTKRFRGYKDRAISHYGGACKHCGEVFHRSVYEFHHIDESTKEHEPRKLIESTKDFEVVKKELDKCLMLCANCHRMEHARLDGTL